MFLTNRATSRIWKVLPNMVFPSIWGKKWRRSEHAHASYPGLFFRPPGFSPYRGARRKESSGTGLCHMEIKVFGSSFTTVMPASAQLLLLSMTQTRTLFKLSDQGCISFNWYTFLELYMLLIQFRSADSLASLSNFSFN